MNLRKETAFLMILAFGLVFSIRCWAIDSFGKVSVNKTIPASMTITVGKSTVIESRELVRRVSLANPEIADAMVLTPRQIYLIGKAPGLTTLTLWHGRNKLSAVFDLEIVPDIERLKKIVREMFPEEENIRIMATHDSISLAGTISSAASLDQIVVLAQSYAARDKEGRPKLNNFLQIGGLQQVMLEVCVSEISRSLMNKLGVNYNLVKATGQEFGVSALDSLSSVDSIENFPLEFPLKLSDGIFTKVEKTTAFPVNPLGLSSSVNAIFRFLDGDNYWTLLLAALKDQGLLKVLAEPTLITLSGKAANFLAGGEFPIPVPQSGQSGVAITVDYKPFGVGLQFTPTVLGNGKISMEVAPEVSNLDFSNALALGGFVIPGLKTRRVSTTIELSDGQSFAVAGLLKDEVREVISKYPLLGDIPILGALFRSKSFQKNETELVIIVTPRLVRPLNTARQTLPTDAYIEPDDFEFYLLGKMEGQRKETSFRPGELPPLFNKEGGLDGDFGHIQP